MKFVNETTGTAERMLVVAGGYSGGLAGEDSVELLNLDQVKMFKSFFGVDTHCGHNPL